MQRPTINYHYCTSALESVSSYCHRQQSNSYLLSGCLMLITPRAVQWLTIIARLHWSLCSIVWCFLPLNMSAQGTESVTHYSKLSMEGKTLTTLYKTYDWQLDKPWYNYRHEALLEHQVHKVVYVSYHLSSKMAASMPPTMTPDTYNLLCQCWWTMKSTELTCCTLKNSGYNAAF